MPWNRLKDPIAGKLKELNRSLQGGSPLAERAAKIAVILAFTVCWLLIVLARSHEAIDPGANGGPLPGLATALQQRAISGRDFQSIYGPAAQLLAWTATAVTVTRSALNAYGMITFFFCAATALIVAAMLLVGDRFSWQQCAVFYAFSILMNLFFDVFDIRTALLLLNAVVAYRVTAADTDTRQIVWATASGLLCFASQLVTVELGICAAIVIVCTLIVGSILTRSVTVLVAVQVFIGTVALANLGLAAVFKITSSSYGLLFDYHNYSLELLRGFHNSMGVSWGLSLAKTEVLALVALYVIGMCAAAAWRSDPLDASLLVSLAFAALVWLETALVRSDIPQIVVAFTPVIVILSLLSKMEWTSRARRVGWSAAAGAVLVVWPSLNLSAWPGLLQVIRGGTTPQAAISAIYATKRPPDSGLRARLAAPDSAGRPDVSILGFPSGNYAAVGPRRRFFAPVLESYAASTEPLERYYVRALEIRRAGLEIIYGPDKGALPSGDDVQAITRTPVIFEYLYKHFELSGNEEHADGYYILRPRLKPQEVSTEPFGFSIPQQSPDSGILRLDAPSTCGLVLLELRIDYAKNPHIFRPGGIELSFTNKDHLVWQGSIKPLAPNASFVTYVSPLPPARFHQVFSQGPVQGVQWDKIQYRASATDVLGSRATFIQLSAAQCVDPNKFVDAAVPDPNPGPIAIDTTAPRTVALD